MDKVSISFKNTEKEYGEAIRAYYSQSKSNKFDFVGGLIIIVGGIGFWSYFGYSWAWVFMIACGIFGLILHLFARYLLPIIRFRQVSKFKDEYHLDFSEDGINFQTEHLNSKLDWSYYSKALETDKFYLLFYGKAMFSIIPKRAFTSDEQQNQFRYFLNKKIGSGVVKI